MRLRFTVTVYLWGLLIRIIWIVGWSFTGSEFSDEKALKAILICLYFWIRNERTGNLALDQDFADNSSLHRNVMENYRGLRLKWDLQFFMMKSASYLSTDSRRLEDRFYNWNAGIQTISISNRYLSVLSKLWYRLNAD